MTSNEAARAALKHHFGYDQFRAGQEEAITAIIDDHHVMAVMPTGAGKSICFQLPALIRDGLAIVVSPLLALMDDQVASLKANGIPAETVNSSQSNDQKRAIWGRLQKGEIKILYISPEKLLTASMINYLKSQKISMFAIDEAHCVSQWGADFRPEYMQLSCLKDEFPNVPIIAVTATADPATRKDIEDTLFDRPNKLITTGFDRENIYIGMEGRTKDWKAQLLEFIKSQPANSCGIVYCLSRKRNEEAAQFLAEQGYNAYPYHAGMNDQQRKNVINIFMRDPDAIICGTVAFGMGIDKADVRWVCHVDLPSSIEAYYQEIGRAGRDGLPAQAHLLFSLQDIVTRRNLMQSDTKDEITSVKENQRLNALVALCETPECRRKSLLSYFGEKISKCGHCDVCTNPNETIDGTEIAKKVFKAIHETGQYFGSVYVTQHLMGNASAKHEKNGHIKLPSFSSGQEFNEKEWQAIIRQLLGACYLELDIRAYGALKLTDRCRDLMEGNDNFAYRPDVVHVTRKAKLPKKTAASLALISEEDKEIFMRLKSLRQRIARAKDVPPYVIFNDKSLIHMSLEKPENRAEFLRINGVGDAKADQYADVFLAAIAGKEED
ncbi:DNA helicase RecQ [Curvivirga aplysinae]|uniref:DNA helicase RecQ n=1 Tax=Curvivirga aplysinae TaxID=2529852 RepID=UPI0012BBE108|nr:DNA helicase RecQ [Curvivirga aplysinae]MTI11450.1 DNA helicase RecQ [Curvivirga aplysinae]